MKKILSLFAVVVLLFFIVGCANNVDSAWSEFEKSFPTSWLSDWKPSDPSVKIGGTGEAWDILSTEGWSWGGSSGKEFTSGDGYYYKDSMIYGKDGKYTYNWYLHEKNSNRNYQEKGSYTGYIYVDNGVMTLTIRNVAWAYYDINADETTLYHKSSFEIPIIKGVMIKDNGDDNYRSYSMFVRQSDEESGIPGTWISEYFNYWAQNGEVYVGKFQEKYELTEDRKYIYTQTYANGETEVTSGEWSVKNANNYNYSGYKGDDYCQSKLLYIWRLNLN